MPTPPDSITPTVLITGAGGFVGHHLVGSVLEQGWTVWAGTRRNRLEPSLKSLSKGQSRDLSEAPSEGSLNHPNLHLIQLDYEHPVHLLEQIAQAPRWQYVIHCAGLTRSIDPKTYTLVNTTYTLNLAKALMNAGKAPDKFLFMSSLEALGPGDDFPFKAIALNRTPRPVSAYGRSKLAAEEGLKAIVGLPWLILRPTGIYGPGDKDYLTMAKLVKNGLAPTMGMKPQRLSFLYIEDLVDVCSRALTSSVTNKSWLVAHPTVVDDRAFITLLQELLKKRRVLKISVPLWLAHGVAMLGDVIGRLSGKPALINTDKYQIMAARNWACDISALQADLGCLPTTDLRLGWTKTLDWYRHQGWL